MKLSENQTSKVLEALNKYAPLSCPICKSQNFQLNDIIFEIREFSGGNLVIGGQSSIFPAITLTCKQCGYSHFFNAVSLGLIGKETK
jgi:predicted nucleic-acid-binding Zn-ribbon protein